LARLLIKDEGLSELFDVITKFVSFINDRVIYHC